jgi:hypothetical protein
VHWRIGHVDAPVPEKNMKRFSVVLVASWIGVNVATAQTNIVRIGNIEAHPTRILAKFKKSRGSASDHELVERAGSQVHRKSQLLPGLVVMEESEPVAKRIAVNETMETKLLRLQNRVDRLRGAGLFEYVEPDYIVHADLTPGDRAFVDGTLWGEVSPARVKS